MLLGVNSFLVPVAGVPMMVSMSIVAIVFLQTPQTFKEGRLTQNSAILDSIGKKSPVTKLSIEIIFSAAAFYLILQIFLATVPLFKSLGQKYIRRHHRGLYRTNLANKTHNSFRVCFINGPDLFIHHEKGSCLFA